MSIQDRAGGIYARVQSLSDRVISRDTRDQFYANISTFATEQPFLASFLLLQLLLSFTPLLLFASFALATILLSFTAALLFTLFWLGAALLVLVPTLFVTVSLALAVWIWGVACFVIAKWVYGLVPRRGGGGVGVALPNGKVAVLNRSGEGFAAEGEVKVKPVVPQKNFGTTEYN